MQGHHSIEIASCPLWNRMRSARPQNCNIIGDKIFRGPIPDYLLPAIMYTGTLRSSCYITLSKFRVLMKLA